MFGRKGLRLNSLRRRKQLKNAAASVDVEAMSMLSSRLQNNCWLKKMKENSMKKSLKKRKKKNRTNQSAHSMMVFMKCDVFCLYGKFPVLIFLK